MFWGKMSPQSERAFHGCFLANKALGIIYEPNHYIHFVYDDTIVKWIRAEAFNHTDLGFIPDLAAYQQVVFTLWASVFSLQSINNNNTYP